MDQRKRHPLVLLQRATDYLREYYDPGFTVRPPYKDWAFAPCSTAFEGSDLNMALQSLLATIRSQLDQAHWIHTLRGPATADQIACLPQGLRSLYEITDGIGIHHIRHRGEIVGTALEVLRSDEIVPIDQAMYGINSQPGVWVGHHWLAVARASDSVYFIAINPEQDKFYSINPIVRDEIELVASSSTEYFAWLRANLPSSEQLNVDMRQSAH